jgi:hypothetical protein
VRKAKVKAQRAPLKAALDYIGRLLVNAPSYPDTPLGDFDAYIVGWLDACDAHERILSAVHITWWLRWATAAGTEALRWPGSKADSTGLVVN